VERYHIAVHLEGDSLVVRLVGDSPVVRFEEHSPVVHFEEHSLGYSEGGIHLVLPGGDSRPMARKRQLLGMGKRKRAQA
jgi:hypothetical protein